MSSVNPLTPFPGTNAIIDSILATLNQPEGKPPQAPKEKQPWQLDVEAGRPLQNRPIVY
ncbi:hypothetical protein ACW9H6_14560 [Pseudomonas sp. SDO528_S397]